MLIPPLSLALAVVLGCGFCSCLALHGLGDHRVRFWDAGLLNALN